MLGTQLLSPRSPCSVLLFLLSAFSRYSCLFLLFLAVEFGSQRDYAWLLTPAMHSSKFSVLDLECPSLPMVFKFPSLAT